MGTVERCPQKRTTGTAVGNTHATSEQVDRETLCTTSLKRVGKVIVTLQRIQEEQEVETTEDEKKVPVHVDKFPSNGVVHVYFTTVYLEAMETVTSTNMIVTREHDRMMYKYPMLYAAEGDFDDQVKLVVDQRKEWILPSPIGVVVGTPMLFVTGLEDGNIIVWDMHLGMDHSVVERHENSIQALAVNQDRYLVACTTKRVHFYDLQRPTPHLIRLVKEKEPSEDCRDVVCCIDLPICFVSREDGSITIYDMRTGFTIGRVGPEPDGQHDLNHWHSKGDCLTVARVDQSKYCLALYNIRDLICAAFPIISNWMEHYHSGQPVSRCRVAHCRHDLTHCRFKW